ncbi:hypothetical protein M9H77_04004 [Catharanthus roseus]|uniref:Uncharacterized protein n=1 Tax=Catharanthus roseus TaxID=4058 RepID=A0ACC0CCU7_CATRO|nr:hypothetical protein M9H77_04004 [Catharanthus roseus]
MTVCLSVRLLVCITDNGVSLETNKKLDPQCPSVKRSVIHVIDNWSSVNRRKSANGVIGIGVQSVTGETNSSLTDLAVGDRVNFCSVNVTPHPAEQVAFWFVNIYENLTLTRDKLLDMIMCSEASKDCVICSLVPRGTLIPYSVAVSLVEGLGVSQLVSEHLGSNCWILDELYESTAYTLMLTMRFIGIRWHTILIGGYTRRARSWTGPGRPYHCRRILLGILSHRGTRFQWLTFQMVSW